MLLQLEFSDKMVTYETFINDLAARLAMYLREQRKDPDFISQRQAYHIFGRNNVMRWRATGKIEPAKRPGRCEYSMVELRKLQNTKQDYFA